MASSVTVKNLPYVRSRSDSTLSARHSPAALTNTVADEHHFVRTLRVERKRTERSGSPFMLMLIDAGVSFEADDVLRQVIGAVSLSIRETDTLGWYKTGSVLGIIFTEIGSADESVIDTIWHKVTTSLRDHLEMETGEHLKLSYHIYPERSGGGASDATDIRLYPDLPRMAEKKKSAFALKRGIDVIGSLLALLLLSPVFLVLAAIIKLTSSGPVLFRQNRIGQHGKAFTFLKFRSMYANNNAAIHEEYVKKLIAGKCEAKHGDGKQTTFKLTNDPRITPIGRFIRRTSLDELPQFFNVLSGDMSLVGPRPPVPYEYEAYDIWHRHRMMEVKPGITGLWQVTGRSRTTFDEMVRLDLRYASSWSIPMDLKILWQTPMAVISGEGAY